MSPADPVSPSPSVRPATREDVEAARGLVRQLSARARDLDDAAFARAFEDVLDDPSQQVWLAQRAHEVVGLLSLSRRPQMRLGGLVFMIDELVVAEDARGKGIGTLLLEFAKGEACRLGARRLELHTGRQLRSYARGFYVKNGFVEVDSAVIRWEADTATR